MNYSSSILLTGFSFSGAGSLIPFPLLIIEPGFPGDIKTQSA
ncbi:MAG TPA: hypothetical protein VJ974_03805 [Geopsychrobacteraceae bacterium]|nr:hypothetical protein [Geopsychrobacteraceae bacterium]